jgi:succinate-acetate transporter protein
MSATVVGPPGGRRSVSDPAGTAGPISVERVTAAAPAAAPAVADPGPLGLAAFAVTTLVLCSVDSGLVENAALAAVVLPLALFYGGIVQLLAGMWEFRKGNTFGAVAFTSYGAFWLSYAGFARVIAPELPATDAHLASGVFLLAWTIFTAYMLIAALKTNRMLIVVFSLLAATFALLTIGALAQAETLTQAGGWIGLATAAAAFYGSASGVVNSTWGRTVLPVGPVSTS